MPAFVSRHETRYAPSASASHLASLAADPTTPAAVPPLSRAVFELDAATSTSAASRARSGAAVAVKMVSSMRSRPEGAALP